jgi:hypothetical protein
MGEVKDMARDPARMHQGKNVAAVRRPNEAGVLPDCLAHRWRHDGVVAGGKGKDGTFKLVFSRSRVPMHQPIEPFVETRDIESVGQGKTGRAA